MFNLILFILLSFFIAFCGSSVKQRESMPTTNDVSVLNQSWNLKIESDISEAPKIITCPVLIWATAGVMFCCKVFLLFFQSVTA